MGLQSMIYFWKGEFQGALERKRGEGYKFF
jgi:hypothetical protein